MSEMSRLARWAGFAMIWAGVVAIAAGLDMAASTSGALGWVGVCLMVFGLFMATPPAEGHADA